MLDMIGMACVVIITLAVVCLVAALIIDMVMHWRKYGH